MLTKNALPKNYLYTLDYFCLTLLRIVCRNLKSVMADVAQLVRALVCGTRCREFESHHPPQLRKRLRAFFFVWLFWVKEKALKTDVEDSVFRAF